MINVKENFYSTISHICDNIKPQSEGVYVSSDIGRVEYRDHTGWVLVCEGITGNLDRSTLISIYACPKCGEQLPKIIKEKFQK